MEINPLLFQGVYSSTAVEPTEKEIKYALKNLDLIMKSKRTFYLDYQNHSLECSCVNHDSQVNGYVFELDETITDVSSDDWGDNDVRLLSLLVCRDCGKWCLCD